MIISSFQHNLQLTFRLFDYQNSVIFMLLNITLMQGGSGHLTFNYTGSQSFICTLFSLVDSKITVSKLFNQLSTGG